MSRFLRAVVISAFAFLTACGGSSGGDSSTPTVLVDRKITGTTITPSSASNIIDGDAATSTTVDSSSVIIDLKAIYNVKEFSLGRLDSSASLGSNPDILIELSSDGLTYQKSNISLISGGVACASKSLNKTLMKCTMQPTKAIRYVRISVKEGKAYDFTEFELIAQIYE